MSLYSKICTPTTKRFLFKTEQRCYDKLHHLQGYHISRYYGLASIDETPALVPSNVGDIAMLEKKKAVACGSQLA